MRRGIVAGFCLAVVLAGCGGQEETVEVVPPGSTAAVVADCGSVVLGQGERIAPAQADCFLDAVAADDQASLEVSFPTVEGDLIRQTYLSLEAGEVRVTTDTTQDRFGSGAVEEQVCTGPVRSSFAFTFANCT